MVKRTLALVALALTLAGCEPGSYVIGGEASFSGAVEAYPGEWTATLDGGAVSLSFATVTPVASATATVTPGPTVTPGGAWWLSGGVDPADCVGAYRGRGAASYAASKVNLCSPGTNDLVVGTVPVAGQGPVVPPDWAAGVGWQGGQGAYFKLPGVYAADDWTAIIRVTNAMTYSQQFAGAMSAGGLQPGFSLNNTGAYQAMKNMSDGAYGGTLVTGTTAIAGKTAYRNGIPLSPPIPPGTGTAPVEWFWLTANWGGVPHGGAHVTEFVAMALYNTTLTDEQVAAIGAAMGGL